MKESEWLTSTDPAAMLAILAGEDGRGNSVTPPRVSDRKLRLFACACCRAVWDRITDERSRYAVEIAELMADGHTAKVEEQAAFDESFRVIQDRPGDAFAAAAHGCTYDDASFMGRVPQQIVVGFAVKFHEAALQANLLREIVGNPFKPLSREPGWCAPTDSRTANLGREIGDRKASGLLESLGGKQTYHLTQSMLTETVRALALTTYADRDFARLPILADALEDAGLAGSLRYTCGGTGTHAHAGRKGEVIHGVLHEIDPRKQHHHHDAKCPRVIDPSPLLAHLRGPGPHALGCWALDLLLGKE